MRSQLKIAKLCIVFAHMNCPNWNEIMFTCLFDLVVVGQGELWDTLQGQKKKTEIHACKLELFDT